MKISNIKTIASIPAELTIKTEHLKEALENYPIDGAVLLNSFQQVVMETPAKGRILCNLNLKITVQRIME